jgi:flagellar assembly protein FliH
MAVIKASQSGPLLKEAIVLDLGDLGRQGERLRAAAEAKTRQIIEAGQKEAERLVAGAREEGLREGRAEGLVQGLAQGRDQGRAEAFQKSTEQLKQLQEAWCAAMKDWDGQREAMEREARQAVLELAIKLAEKLTHRMVEVDPTLVVEQVRVALRHVLRPLDLTLRIHPEDRGVVEEAMPRLTAEFPHFPHLQLANDPQVGRAGCVVSYGRGRIDATLDTQLRRIVELLLPEPTALTKESAPSDDT